MPCIPVPKVPQPSLPGGLTLGATVPSVPSIPDLTSPCCKIVAFTPPPIGVPVPALALNPGTIAAIRAVIDQINGFFDSLVPDCPRN